MAWIGTVFPSSSCEWVEEGMGLCLQLQWICNFSWVMGDSCIALYAKGLLDFEFWGWRMLWWFVGYGVNSNLWVWSAFVELVSNYEWNDLRALGCVTIAVSISEWVLTSIAEVVTIQWCGCSRHERNLFSLVSVRLSKTLARGWQCVIWNSVISVRSFPGEWPSFENGVCCVWIFVFGIPLSSWFAALGEQIKFICHELMWLFQFWIEVKQERLELVTKRLRCIILLEPTFCNVANVILTSFWCDLLQRQAS